MGSIQPASSNAWKVIIEIVLSKPAHIDVPVSKFEVPDPLLAGFEKHFGDFAGQVANYRLPLPDGREIHVKEYNEDYSAHWDNTSAIRDPFGHILRDGTKWFFLIIGIALLGAFAAGFWVASKLGDRTPKESST